LDAGFFGDAVEASFKEVNDAVKRLVRDADGRDLDGAGLIVSVCRAVNRMTGFCGEKAVVIQG
jgi:hypothetical protein